MCGESDERGETATTVLLEEGFLFDVVVAVDVFFDFLVATVEDDAAGGCDAAGKDRSRVEATGCRRCKGALG